MTLNSIIKELKSSQEFFNRSTRCLVEADSNFKPTPESMSAAQQIAHVASTIEWFLDGAFSPNGFDMEFEKHAQAISKINSILEARAWLERSYAQLFDKVASLSEKELYAAMSTGPIMDSEPRLHALLGIIEHTAHHRGALTVYSRLLGKTPAMPYMEM